MTGTERLQAEWEGLQLVVEEMPEYFCAFVYDPGECEVIYTAERMSAESAKIAAVEFAATTLFGAHNDLCPEVVAAMLVWERT